MTKQKSLSKKKSCRSTRFLPLLLLILNTNQLFSLEKKSLKFKESLSLPTSDLPSSEKLDYSKGWNNPYTPKFENQDSLFQLELSFNKNFLDAYFTSNCRFPKDLVECCQVSWLPAKYNSAFDFSYKLTLPDYNFVSSVELDEITKTLIPSREFTDWIKNKSADSNIHIFVQNISTSAPKIEAQDAFFKQDIKNFSQISSLIKTGQVISKVFLETPKIEDFPIPSTASFLRCLEISNSSLMETASYDLSPEPIISIDLVKKIIQIGLAKISITNSSEFSIQDSQPIDSASLNLEKIEIKPENSIFDIPVSPIAIEENEKPQELSADETLIASIEDSSFSFISNIIFNLDPILQRSIEISFNPSGKIENPNLRKFFDHSIYEKASLEFASTVTVLENDFLESAEPFEQAIELDSIKVCPKLEILGKIYEYPSKSIDFELKGSSSDHQNFEIGINPTSIQIQESFLAPKLEFESTAEGPLEVISSLEFKEIPYDIKPLPVYELPPSQEYAVKTIDLAQSKQIIIKKELNAASNSLFFAWEYRDQIKPLRSYFHNHRHLDHINSNLNLDLHEIILEDHLEDFLAFKSSFERSKPSSLVKELPKEECYPNFSAVGNIISAPNFSHEPIIYAFRIEKLNFSIYYDQNIDYTNQSFYNPSIKNLDLLALFIPDSSENYSLGFTYDSSSVKKESIKNFVYDTSTSSISFSTEWIEGMKQLVVIDDLISALIPHEPSFSKSNLIFYSPFQKDLASVINSLDFSPHSRDETSIEIDNITSSNYVALEEALNQDSFFVSIDIIKKLPEIRSKSYDYISLLSQNEEVFDPMDSVNSLTPKDYKPSLVRTLLGRRSADYLTLVPTLRDLNTYVLTTEFRNEVEVIASPDGQSYYFSAKIIPYYPEDLRKIHQNIYFVLDQSRTISEERFEAFKKGIIRSIPYLSSDATFNIVVLNKNCEILSQANIYNDKYSLEIAKNFLDKISYGFITAPQDYTKALSLIKRRFESEKNSLNTVILLSDGAYYKNYRADHDKIAELCQFNEDFFQIYTVTASQDNYLGALDMISFLNHGELVYSKTHVALPRQMAILVKNLKNPIATNLYLSTIRNESNQVEFFPASGQMQAFYADRPFTIYGKTDRLQNLDLMIQGKVEDEWINVTQKINLRQAKSGSRELLRTCQMLEKKLSYFEETTHPDET